MTSNTFKIYSLSCSETKAYLLILVFTAANLLLAAGCHVWPFHDQQLARMFLPTFFFTLIAAYKYGIFVGVMTAVFTLVGNYYCFDYLHDDMLIAVAAKTFLLALAAGFSGMHFRKVNLLILAGIVVSYQVVGTMAVCILGNSNQAMINAFLISWPGMLVQIFGGWLVLRFLLHK